jgi:hypothetical protein
LIVVADQDLARALATGLQACAVACDIRENLADISSEPHQDWQGLVIDAELLSVAPDRYVTLLGQCGWSGLTVLLCEDGKLKSSLFSASDNVAVLTKPFGRPQLLDIAERLQARAAKA